MLQESKKRTQDYWQGKVDAYLSLMNKMNGYTNNSANEYLQQKIDSCVNILNEIQLNKKQYEKRRFRKIKEVQSRIRGVYKKGTSRQRVPEDGAE